jgi:hypothetical protein
MRRSEIFTARRVTLGAVISIVVLATSATIVGLGAREHWGREIPASEPDGLAYASDCHSVPTPDLESCTLRPAGPSIGTIVLVGDSHAASLADGVITAGNNLGTT